MKKLICLLLCFCLVGCSSVKTTKKDKSDDSETTETTKTEVDASTTKTDAKQTNPGSLPLSERSNVVVIDAGHGGVDPGCNNGDIYEKDITLKYALTLGAILQNNGIQVAYIRTDDSNLTVDTYRLSDGSTKTNDLRARAELGETYNAALYVSLHVDSADVSSSGYTVYVHSGHQDSVDLGNDINANLAALGYTTSRGVLDGSGLRVLRCNTTIACLIELGFITGDLDKLLDETNQEAICQAIADGIMTKLNAGWDEPDLVLEKQPDLY